MPENLFKHIAFIGAALGVEPLQRLADPEYRDGLNWKWVVGVAGVVISGLLVIVGFLISAGLHSNQTSLFRIESRQMQVIEGMSSIKTEVARIDQKVNDHIDQTRRLYQEPVK